MPFNILYSLLYISRQHMTDITVGDIKDQAPWSIIFRSNNVNKGRNDRRSYMLWYMSYT